MIMTMLQCCFAERMENKCFLDELTCQNRHEIKKYDSGIFRTLVIWIENTLLTTKTKKKTKPREEFQGNYKDRFIHQQEMKFYTRFLFFLWNCKTRILLRAEHTETLQRQTLVSRKEMVSNPA